jgi:ATP-binding cassette subfamily C (CFTR/MRP) protein 1
LEYSKEASEEAWEIPENQPPAYWPLDGNITFDNVSVVGHGNKRLLANVNVTIPAGEKIGIVGRSGLNSCLMKIN